MLDTDSIFSTRQSEDHFQIFFVKLGSKILYLFLAKKLLFVLFVAKSCPILAYGAAAQQAFLQVYNCNSYNATMTW